MQVDWSCITSASSKGLTSKNPLGYLNINSLDHFSFFPHLFIFPSSSSLLLLFPSLSLSYSLVLPLLGFKLFFSTSVWSPPPSQRGRTVSSWPGDAVPSPADCVLHQPGVPPAAAGSAGGGTARHEQVTPHTHRADTFLTAELRCSSLIGWTGTLK